MLTTILLLTKTLEQGSAWILILDDIFEYISWRKFLNDRVQGMRDRKAE